MNDRQRRIGVAILALTVAALAVAPNELLAGDAMTLRISDTMAEPGDRVAVVLRTYAPRGISQGQICFAARNSRGPGGTPFVALEEAVVFSELGDAEVVQVFDGPAQMALIEFTSLSATVNWADGPLAVLFFRLDPGLQPGWAFALDLDLAETFLIDAQGQSVPLEPRGGVLTVRAPGAPYELAAEGDNVAGGAVAALGVDTSEVFAIGGGQMALRWDPAVAAGPPAVSMDPRHGHAVFDVDLDLPGRALVTFTSPDGSLNEVPGKIVSIDLPIAASAPPGSSYPVTLDPLLTRLRDPGGSPIPIALIADVLELELAGPIFADGFESGDTASWSSTTKP